MKKLKKLELQDCEDGKKQPKLRRVTIIAIIFTLLLEIFMVNRLSTYGEKIEKVKLAQESVKLENQVLANQIADISSLNSIEEKAYNLGFVSMKNIKYVKISDLALDFKSNSNGSSF